MDTSSCAIKRGYTKNQMIKGLKEQKKRRDKNIKLEKTNSKLKNTVCENLSLPRVYCTSSCRKKKKARTKDKYIIIKINVV